MAELNDSDLYQQHHSQHQHQHPHSHQHQPLSHSLPQHLHHPLPSHNLVAPSDSDHGSNGNNNSRRSFGRSAGVLNYSKDDISLLVGLVDEIRPVGKHGWTKVTRKYNGVTRQYRQSDCLRRKFLSLFAAKNVSPRQENIVAEVYERAKNVYEEIIAGRGNVEIENSENDSEEGEDRYSGDIILSTPMLMSDGNENCMGIPVMTMDNHEHGKHDSLSKNSSRFSDDSSTSNSTSRRPFTANGMSTSANQLGLNQWGSMEFIRELTNSVKIQQDSISNMSGMVSSLLNQTCRQQADHLASLNNQVLSNQQKILQLFELQQQQNNLLTSVCQLVLKHALSDISSVYCNEDNNCDVSDIANRNSSGGAHSKNEILRNEIGNLQQLLSVHQTMNSAFLSGDGSSTSLVSTTPIEENTSKKRKLDESN